jgi:subtilisin
VTVWPTLLQARSFLLQGRGEGVKIAVLDSGIEVGHPRLTGLKLLDDLAITDAGTEFGVVPGEGRDVFGHGTAIAAILREVAPAAQIGSFRVLGENLRSRSQIIREGVRQALERGYDILNCSFGCGREDQVLLYKDWIDEAYLLHRHIVASCNNQNFMKREWPGHFPTVITVNFTDCQAPEIYFRRHGHLVEFYARGRDLEVPWRDGAQKKVTGSSFAAPTLAGLLARLLSGCRTFFAEPRPDAPQADLSRPHCPPALSPLQAKAILLDLAVEWKT